MLATSQPWTLAQNWICCVAEAVTGWCECEAFSLWCITLLNPLLPLVHYYRTTRVWNLFSGVLLWTATMNSSVSQIIMLPHYILLLADEVSIQRFSWLTQGGRLEATGPSILTGASMRRFLIHDRKLVYVRNGGAIVILDWCTGETLHQLSLGCTDIDLVAVGAKFMLAALWNNFCRKQELVIIDLSSGSVVGSYPMP